MVRQDVALVVTSALASSLLVGAEAGMAARRALACEAGVEGGCTLDEAQGGMNLLQHAASARGTRHRKRPYPLCDEVYTYGAPATHSTPLRNAATEDGCFPGLRSYTEDIKGSSLTPLKQVDAAAINNFYPHAWTNSVDLHWDMDSYYTPCVGYPEPQGQEEHPEKHGHPDWPKRGAQVYVEWRLHHENHYTDRLNECTVNGKKVANKEPFLSARRFVLFAFKAYDTIPNTKRDIAAQMPEWHLVSRDVYKTSNDQDPVMVVQNYNTLDCAFVFTGTNNLADLPSSTNTYGTGYCGFEGVHAGYRNELWTLTKNLWGKVRPTLEKCNKVVCVGHSLGGALCELFAACANSGNYTDPDYQLLHWEKAKNPTKMPELSDDADDGLNVR